MSNQSKSANKWRALRREFAVKVHNHGAWGAFRLGLLKLSRRLRERALGGKPQVHEFDVKYRTDTSARVELGDLDIPDDRLNHAIAYGTAIVGVFLQMLKELPIRHEDFVFIDLGSGKGRALLLASAYPFKAIVGVELSASLHQIALRNIQIFRDPDQRCRNIQSINEDAMAFKIPGENAVFYLFNPFDEEVIRPVLAHMELSLRAHPRKFYILYLKTLHRRVFDQAGFLRILKDTGRYVIYESLWQQTGSGSSMQPIILADAGDPIAREASPNSPLCNELAWTRTRATRQLKP